MALRKLKSKKNKVFKKKPPKKANLRRAKKKITPPISNGGVLKQVKNKPKIKKKIKTQKKHKVVLRRAKKPLARKKIAKKKIISGRRKLTSTLRRAGGISKKKLMKKNKIVKKIRKIKKKKVSRTVKPKLLRGTVKKANKIKKLKKTSRQAPASPKRLQSRKRGVQKYFLNYQFQFIDELRDLVLKSSPDEMNKMTRQLSNMGKIKLAVVTGIFLNRVNPDSMTTDLFIVVDDIDRRKFRSLLRSIEAELGREIRYVIMEKEEFQYRLSMFDRFIRVLLESPHEKLINHLGI